MQMAPVNLIEAHSLSFLKVISVNIQENKILIFGIFWNCWSGGRNGQRPICTSENSIGATEIRSATCCVLPVCVAAECTRAVCGRSDMRRICCRSDGTMESSDRLPTAHLAIDLPPYTSHRSGLSTSRNQRTPCRASHPHPRRAPQAGTPWPS